MPKVNITNTFTRTVKPSIGKRKELYSDINEIGFILEVRSNSMKTFYYRYSNQGKVKYKKLADYPTITAKRARQLVQRLKKKKMMI